MSKTNPVCCGVPSVEVVQSVNLKYFFCKECKNEVVEDPFWLSKAVAASEPPGWAASIQKMLDDLDKDGYSKGVGINDPDADQLDLPIDLIDKDSGSHTVIKCNHMFYTYKVRAGGPLKGVCALCGHEL